MISFQTALETILKEKIHFKIQELNLSEIREYHILAEDIYADRDFPPFNRVMMDGIALNFALTDFKAPLKVIDVIPAGSTSQKTLSKNEVFKIATGAKLPDCCDLVIQKELLEEKNDIVFYQKDELPKIGKNIHFKGMDKKAGEKLFSLGQKINSSVLACLATVGKTSVKCFLPPSIAFMSTGNEVIDISKKPDDVQIRDANAWALHYKLQNWGVKTIALGIAQDDEKSLEEKIKLGLEADILIISAGVSAGDKDLVPVVLKKLGVVEIFHRIKMKPGKPVWFGKKEKKLVFGLPGNPVSVMVTLELLVKPLFHPNQTYEGNLKADYQKNEMREEWSMAIHQNGSLELIPHSSSGDMVHLAKANALVNFPEGKNFFSAGTKCKWVSFS